MAIWVADHHTMVSCASSVPLGSDMEWRVWVSQALSWKLGDLSEEHLETLTKGINSARQTGVHQVNLRKKHS
jgi:hypothetical protein